MNDPLTLVTSFTSVNKPKINCVSSDVDDSKTENEEPMPVLPTGSELTRALMTLPSVYGDDMTLAEIQAADIIAGISRKLHKSELTNFFRRLAPATLTTPTVSISIFMFCINDFSGASRQCIGRVEVVCYFVLDHLYPRNIRFIFYMHSFFGHFHSP